MRGQPDMSFDIDALFKHMVKNLGHTLGTELQWDFLLRSKSLTKLRAVRRELQAEFNCQLQKEVPTIESGREFMGPPMMSVGRLGALKPATVKAIAARMTKLAKSYGVEYEGVSCYEPLNEEVVFGWQDLDGGIWRLRHFSDCGMKWNEPLPFVFSLTAKDTDALKDAASALRKMGGFRPGRVTPDSDRRGWFLMPVRCEGKNNEQVLRRRYEKVSAIGKEHGVNLLGVKLWEG